MQRPARQSFDGALQLQQGEGRWHQLEDHRPVFDLGSQPRDPGSQDAAMVVAHRHARHGVGDRPARLGNQPGLMQQLIALQHEVLVPTVGAAAEIDVDSLASLAPRRRVGRRIDPLRQPRQDQLCDQR